MKKLFTLLVSFVLFAVISANAQRNCAAHDVLMQQLANDPNMAERMAKIESQTNEFIQNATYNITPTQIVDIPVVVHVLYRTTQENISDAQIQSQIAVLNEDFRRLNADINNTPNIFAPLTADILIQFHLATKTPTGAATTGIERKKTTKTSWGTNDAMKNAKKGGLNAWNSAKYLNLWVCNIGGGILGYAQFPGGAAATDGVVIGPNYFGRVGYLSAPYNKGRTATHEIGHWLNLRHIWGDATCGNDYCNDTPLHNTANYGMPTFPHYSTCTGTPVEMTMNYMDYTDDAGMYMFSLNQKDRMRALFATGGAREQMAINNPAFGAGNRTTANEIALDKAVDLYPNPANEIVKLSLYNFSENVNVTVVDMTGNVVMRIDDYQNNTELNISNLKAGFYFINVIDGKESVTKKFVKLR